MNSIQTRLRGGGLLLALLAAFALLSLFGCSTAEQQDPQVRKIGDTYFEAMMAGDIEQAASLFGGEKGPQEWRNELRMLRDKMGPMKQYTFRREESNTVYSGQYHTLKYTAKYENGDTYESLILFHHVSRGGLEIVSHTVKPRRVDSDS